MALMNSIQPQVELNFNHQFNQGFLPRLRSTRHAYEMAMSILGTRIRQKLKDVGKTQSWLAGKMDLSDEAVSKWVLGKADPGLANLRKLAGLLRCSVGYLAGDQQDDDIAAVVDVMHGLDDRGRITVRAKVEEWAKDVGGNEPRKRVANR